MPSKRTTQGPPMLETVGLPGGGGGSGGSPVEPKTWHLAVVGQIIYSLSGLVLGLACVLGGIVLFLRGVTGSTSWTAKFIGAESQVADAAPGVVLFIVGLFVVFVTRYKVGTGRKD